MKIIIDITLDEFIESLEDKHEEILNTKAEEILKKRGVKPDHGEEDGYSTTQWDQIFSEFYPKITEEDIITTIHNKLYNNLVSEELRLEGEK